MNYLPIVIAIAIPTVFIMALKHPHLKKQMIRGMSKIETNKNNISGILGYIILFSVVGLLSGETFVANLLAGYLYGPFKGTMLMSIIYFIVTIGWSYLTPEQALEELETFERKDEVINQLIKVKDELSDREKIELIMLSRLSPLLPYHMISFMWYSTGISVPMITGASVIGAMPLAFTYCYLGSMFPTPKKVLEHKVHFHTENMKMILIGGVLTSVLTYGVHEGSRYIIQNHRAVKK